MFNIGVNDTKIVLKNLKETVTDCKNEIKMGFYHPENKFIHAIDKVTKSTQNNRYSTQNLLFCRIMIKNRLKALFLLTKKQGIMPTWLLSTSTPCLDNWAFLWPDTTFMSTELKPKSIHHSLVILGPRKNYLSHSTWRYRTFQPYWSQGSNQFIFSRDMPSECHCSPSLSGLRLTIIQVLLVQEMSLSTNLVNNELNFFPD